MPFILWFDKFWLTPEYAQINKEIKHSTISDKEIRMIHLFIQNPSNRRQPYKQLIHRVISRDCGNGE